MLTVAMALVGCSAKLVPIGQDRESAIETILRTDETIQVLASTCQTDPRRVLVTSAEPSEKAENFAEYLNGYYDDQTDVAFRNRTVDFSPEQFQNLVIHEYVHHVWEKCLTADQKQKWLHYLETQPNRWTGYVRARYNLEILETEEFARSVETGYPASAKKLRTVLAR